MALDALNETVNLQLFSPKPLSNGHVLILMYFWTWFIMTRKTRRGWHSTTLISKFLSCFLLRAMPLVGALQFCLLVQVSSCQYTHTLSLYTFSSLTAAISWSEPNWRKDKQISEIVQFSAATTVPPTLSTGPCLISMNTVFPSELVTRQAVWTDRQADRPTGARIYKVVCTCPRQRQHYPVSSFVGFTHHNRDI